MTFTKEKIDSIHPVYRDFLLALKPVIDTRKRGAVIQVGAVHYGQILDSLRSDYGQYNSDEIAQVARELKARGLVEEDKFGFFRPTDKGELLIEALAGEQEPALSTIPPFPDL
jgi:hypothetical protein